MSAEYPVWVCLECGKKHGRRVPEVACWHIDLCDVCGQEKECTEPRDFGHFPRWGNEE